MTISQPAGHHLAELNVGRLLAPTDDPRVSEFMENLDRVNGIGKRSAGFVWIMEGADPSQGNTEAKIDGDPQFVANLTVWEDPESFRNFVFNTLHKRFMDRKAEWFETLADQHFVMWWVPEGHEPTLEEALERLKDLQENGPSERAFGWSEIGQPSR